MLAREILKLQDVVLVTLNNHVVDGLTHSASELELPGSIPSVLLSTSSLERTQKTALYLVLGVASFKKRSQE